MNTHNELVVKIREKLFCRHKKQEGYEENETNVFFVNFMIGRYGIEKVSSAGLLLLSEMKESEYSWLDNVDYGIPRNSLEALFKKALEGGYKTEIENAVLEMYDKGNPSCSFLFPILKEKASIFFLEKLSKEMKKKKRFSKQGGVKKEFTKNYEKVIEDLISKPKVQSELPFFSQSLPQDKTPVKT